MTLLDDLRYAARTLKKSPGFAIVAIATLALGIGANSAIWSVLHGVLLRPLPYQDPDRLVRIYYADPEQAGGISAAFSPQDFDDLTADLGRSERGKASPFARIAASHFMLGLTGMNLTGGGEPERVDSATVSGGYFSTLGVPAAIGRTIQPSDDVAGKDRVVVLSDGLWRRRFGADSTVVGKQVTLEGESFTVVGVMPPSFALPAREVDLWAPISLIGDDDIPHLRGLRWMDVVARLAPGATPEQATAASSAVFTRLARAYPETNEKRDRALVRPLRESLVGDLRPALLVLISSVALVLLIACANLASLLLARTTTRRHEFAVRVALGAGGGRLARQILTENVLLALVGGGLGFVMAGWGVEALVALGGAELPRAEEIRPDASVFLFTLAISLATGILSGLLPALRASRSDAREALREGGRGGGEGRRGRTARGALVAAETALATVLLIGAGLMVRSFWSLLHVDPGFRTENVLALSISLQDGKFADPVGITGYQNRVLARLAELPGVVAVGGSKTLPLRGGGEPYDFAVDGRDERITPEAGTFIVTPGYFRALGIPLLAGRDFTVRDGADAPPAVIVNRALAHQLWPEGGAVGRHVRFGEKPIEVIGVAGDVRHAGLATAPGPALYLPNSVAPRSTMKIFVRTAGDPLGVAGAVRAAIGEADRNQPISDLAPLSQLVSEAVVRPRFTTLLLGLFGALALGLAALGTYGVVAYAVSQRTHEIGVRMALGAKRSQVLGMVVRQASMLTLAGLGTGLVAAFALTRWLSGLLYGISTTDPLAFLAAPLALALVALYASYLPARRAADLDPLIALRRD
ncbi:MAG TPA: ABC transporter permease [Thermoanaerobaculia bacterium]|jgi:predicted permease|nr:ABC transporter permease [Thermoanaerobaculia bacterium]